MAGNRNGSPMHISDAAADALTIDSSLQRPEPLAAKNTRENRHKYFMTIALAVRLRANCKGNRVGAIIVKDHRIVSTGYNGTPTNMVNCLDDGCYRCANRDKTYRSGEAYDLCICVHAEQNAILAAARFGIAVEGSTLYTTMRPCFGCAKEMLQASIHTIYYLHEWSPAPDQDVRRTEAQGAIRQINGALSRRGSSAGNGRPRAGMGDFKENCCCRGRRQSRYARHLSKLGIVR